MSNQPIQRTPSAALNLQSEPLSFRDVPETSRLFLDFIYEFERVKQFYSPVEPRREALIEFALTIIRQKYPRDLLVEVLLEQNHRFSSSPQPLDYIEQLRDPTTVAIVTGQQAGLFTGPIYTILKALTAVRVSRDLRAHGISAVPLFWIESDDHDQAEVNHTALIDRQGQWKPVIYSIDPSEAGKSISKVWLTDAITHTIDELVNLLPPSEFMPGIERQIREAYTPGISMAEAFARLMAQWFQGLGLILLDPTDVRWKRALRGLFETAIRGSSEIATALLDQTQRLIDAGYHAQLRVTSDMVPLFIERREKRAALLRQDSQFVVKTGDGAYTLDDLLEVARTEPERLSPSVALRPLVQDTLLPTLAYIGGPSEMAYLGQLTPLAAWLGRPATPILPRISATFVEQRYAKLLRTYNLQFQDLFGGFNQVIQTVVGRNLGSSTMSLFDETERSLEGHLDQIHQALVETDPTLARATETAREKILYQLSHLRTRFTETQARKEELTYRQIQRAFNVLYPDGGLQERQLNILHFLSRYGPGLLHQLSETLDVWRPDHQLIFLR